MAARKTPKRLTVGVSYSYGAKMNLGKKSYESADIHVSRSETFDVEGMTDKAVADFVQKRHNLLKEEVDGIVLEEYQQVSCFSEANDT